MNYRLLGSARASLLRSPRSVDPKARNGSRNFTDDLDIGPPHQPSQSQVLEQAPSEQSQKSERMSTSSSRKEEDRPTRTQQSLFESKSKAADDSLSLPVGLHVTAKADATDATGGADTNHSSPSRPKTKTTVTDAGTRTSTNTTMNSNTKKAESDTLNDPTKFWAAWSARKQHDCLDGNGNTKKGCNCFEGLGSVM